MEVRADGQVTSYEVERLPGMEERPVRRRRHDAGTIQLTERDIKALAWVGQQYAVRVDHLQMLLGRWAVRETQVAGVLSKGTIERIVKRWRVAGWVQARQVLAGEPTWVWLTRAGLQHIGLPYKVWEAKAATLNHLYWCNAVRIWLEQRDVEKQRQGTWYSERELRYQAEYIERRHRAEQQIIHRQHLPDAEVVYGTTKVAIEVELTPKVQNRALAIMRELVRHYGAVWYFVRRETREIITTAQGQITAAERAKVKLMELDYLG